MGIKKHTERKMQKHCLIWKPYDVNWRLYDNRMV